MCNTIKLIVQWKASISSRFILSAITWASLDVLSTHNLIEYKCILAGCVVATIEYLLVEISVLSEHTCFPNYYYDSL